MAPEDSVDMAPVDFMDAALADSMDPRTRPKNLKSARHAWQKQCHAK
jgi:hypothetical protein